MTVVSLGGAVVALDDVELDVVVELVLDVELVVDVEPHAARSNAPASGTAHSARRRHPRPLVLRAPPSRPPAGPAGDRSDVDASCAGTVQGSDNSAPPVRTAPGGPWRSRARPSGTGAATAQHPRHDAGPATVQRLLVRSDRPPRAGALIHPPRRDRFRHGTPIGGFPVPRNRFLHFRNGMSRESRRRKGARGPMAPSIGGRHARPVPVGHRRGLPWPFLARPSTTALGPFPAPPAPVTGLPPRGPPRQSFTIAPR